ncbi:MAG: hypothetical protein AB7O38_22355, partial [Pirellulaceae bacterium]
LAMVCGKDQVSLYADGKPAADSNNFPPHPADEHLGDGFTLGASLTKEGTTFRNLPGRIHAVRISKAARYMGDFAPVRRLEPDPQTIALYSFETRSGEVLPDVSGNNHHGKIVGARWIPLTTVDTEKK